jgi:3-methylfumaryl-CoA hydratase
VQGVLEKVPSRIDASTLDEWEKHVGRERVQRETLHVDVLRKFAAATGASTHVELSMPPMAHWAYFLDAVGDADLGSDGHPLTKDFLPPVRLPRRMFAAADIRFERALELGKSAACITRVVDVRHRAGASGELVFVELERQVIQSHSLRVHERQTLVYRDNGPSMAPIESSVSLDNSLQAWTPSPVELFRFSAVTFNAHRIHYDAPYATAVEGYPALVVHGPFTAIKLLNFALTSSCRPVHSFSFRIIAPLFVSQPVTFSAGDAVGTFVAERCDGTVAVTGKVEFHE